MRAVACGVCVSTWAMASPAPTTPRLKARALYAEGEKALEAGDAETAQRDYEEAYRTLPNASVLLKIAECQSRRSNERGAVETLQRYLKERATAPDRASVEERIAGLKKTPGVVSVSSSPPGAAIWVDGSDAAKTTPAEVRLTPGEHIVAVQLPRYETVQQTIVVDFASRPVLELTLAPSAAPTAGQGETEGGSPEGAQSGHSGGYRLTPAFWVAAGFTAVGAGVMTGFGVVALGEHSDYQQKPTRALYDDGRRDALIADVGLGVTAASAITAAVLFFTSKQGDHREEHALQVAPSFVRNGAGITGNVRF